MFRALILVVSFAFSFLANAKPYPIVFEPSPFNDSTVYRPNDNLTHLSIVLLHGSEGGSLHRLRGEASALASQGYAVLAFCYFDCGRGINGPLGTLKNVEVTEVLEAVKWLRKQPTSNGKVVVYGFSRGAELTMITGSLDGGDDMPNALIAHAPSDTFNGPFNWSWNEHSCWLCKTRTCGEDAPQSAFSWNPSCGPDDPNKIDNSKSAWMIDGKSVKNKVRIELEKFKGPILITVGEKDEVWPVDQTRRIEATLKGAGNPAEVHYFPEAGHAFKFADEMHRRELVLDFLERVR